jgi:hypothetical protein
MDRYRYLTWPSYLIAIMLVVVPLFDAAMQLGAFNPGSSQWRFGAIGLLSNAFLLPGVGLLVMFAVAVFREHVRFLRIFGVLLAVCAAVAFGLVLLFALDAIQTRVMVQEAARLSFVVASWTAVGKLALAVAVLTLLARGGLRTRRGKVAARAKVRSPLAPADARPGIS